MSTTAPHRPLSSLLQPPAIREVHPPQWFERLPRWQTTGGILAVLLLVAGFLHSRQLHGQLWFNEAIATGMASHSLSALPGILRQAGSSPLYYALLHVWIAIFGSSSGDTHLLSFVLALACIPVGCWAGWTIAGRRMGIFAAVLFAFSSYLTKFGQETQPYALMMLLGLLTTTGFVHAFAYRRRWGLWLFCAGLALLLYTQASTGLYASGALVAFAVVYRLSEGDRRSLLRDAAIGFGVPFVLYLPWLPTTIYQIGHATSPWHYAPLLGADVPSDLLGGERVDATLLVAAIIGLAPLVLPARRRTPDALAAAALIAIPVAAMALGRCSSLVTPGWVARYFAPMVAGILLLGAFGAARSKLVGIAAIVLCVAFNANPGSFAPAHKSDMQDIAGELGPLLHPGDLVVSAQPEQTPLAWYYLPSGLRFASTTGTLSNPGYMDWSRAQSRLQAANPAATLGPLVASLRPGQQLLYVRPLTEGVENWRQPWSQLVRRRAAQWGQILTTDVTNGMLKAVAWAPHNYRSACCVANSATLYQKAP